MKIITRKYESTPIATWGEYLYSFNPFRTIYWTVTSIEAGFIEIANQIVMMKFRFILKGENMTTTREISADISPEEIQLFLSSSVNKKEIVIIDHSLDGAIRYLPMLDCIRISSIASEYKDAIYIRNTDSLRFALHDYLEFRSWNKLGIKDPKIA